ncbi:MAG: class I SAM-dependent methyltransferase [Proteobacteria bacterium]|nr:class I SAM-dependent methyltransferase [Pseudomonadota bacterium]MDA1355911.1 class I SAM-dependent methyltransferase [Pseudomonadota bacterium]
MTSEHFQFGTDIEALARLVPLQGRRFVHVGCGDGALSFALAKRGASMLGVESDPERARENRALGSVQGVTLAEGYAQNLPQNDGTVDGVIMLDFLSRVDAVDMDDCLTEACRVLKENDGLLYVGDNDSSGFYDDMVRMFYDNSAERTWALDALRRLPHDVASSVREIHYVLKRQFTDFESFAGSFLALNETRLMIENMNSAHVRTVFEQGRKGNIFEFEQARRVNLYRTGTFAPVGA